MFFQSGLAGGSILIDQRHFDAVLFLEFQFAQAIRGDVTGIHAEIGPAAEVLARKSKGLAEGFLRAKLSRLGGSQKDRHKHRHNEHRRNQQHKDRFTHVRFSFGRTF